MKKFIGFLLVLFLFLTLLPLSACKKEQITTYDICCELNGNVLTGKEKVCFYNDSENAFSELKFNLFANAYREGALYSPVSTADENRCYYLKKNYGKEEIISVYGQNDQPLPFSITGVDQNILTVNLQKEVYPNECAYVCIEYSITLANVISRTGVNDKTVNLANFYPILCGIENQSFYECVYYSTGDPYFSDVANYRVELTIDKDFIVATSGELQSQTETGDKKTLIYKRDNIRSFSMSVSKNYKVMEDFSGDVKINYYYLDDPSPLKSMETAKTALSLFSELFGKYLYSSYSFCQTPFIEGGMEFPALTFISSDLESKAYQEVIVHETAHQWWQTAVGNNEIECGFLDEGLTEYSVVLFYENNPSYNLTRSELIKSSEKTYHMFCSVYDKLYNHVNTAMLRSLKDFDSEYEYVNIAYVKPCIMYEYLRNTVKDQKFFDCLKTYYKEYSLKNAQPFDIVGVFEKKGDTCGFFEGFYNGTVIL